MTERPFPTRPRPITPGWKIPMPSGEPRPLVPPPGNPWVPAPDPQNWEEIRRRIPSGEPRDPRPYPGGVP